MEKILDGRILSLESFTADLFSSGSKEMKEVVRLITRLMNLVIGALDQVEQQMNRLEGRIRSIESHPMTVGAPASMPISVPRPSPSSVPESGEGGIKAELRSAIAQRSGAPSELPSSPIPAHGEPVVTGDWQPGFEGFTKAPPDAAGGPEAAPPTGGLGIRAALQDELKQAFKKLKSSMETEE